MHILGHMLTSIKNSVLEKGSAYKDECFGNKLTGRGRMKYLPFLLRIRQSLQQSQIGAITAKGR